MELNFDKEIDAILRKARESEAAFAAADPPSHLDADEISAFAENVLPETAKLRSTAHLADCDRCRKILSNVILQNAGTKSEIVHAAEKTAVASAVPWYRRLFQFPNLAYSLGALTLVFGAMIAFIVLQVLNPNAEVSQMSNKPSETKSAPSMANSNANMSANSATTNMSAGNMNSVSVPSNAAMPDAYSASNANRPAQPAATPAMPGEEARRDDDTLAALKDSSVQLDGLSQQEDKERAALNKSEINKKQNEQLPITNQPPLTGADKNSRKMSDRAKTLGAAEGETTTAGGKTFRRSNNVWYDIDYQNQATTNVTRGTKEYKKLDKDMRVIVENIGGTVVIVWKGKAYRIR